MRSVTKLRDKAQALNTVFDRTEMSQILDVYGRLVMAGEAKDYAIGMYPQEAVFAIFRRHAEQPTWRVLKTPALARAQGAFAVMGGQGQILKRGRELKQVLSVFSARRFELID